jgi:uncharacterized membrane protein YbhN (UPF0104 family)
VRVGRKRLAVGALTLLITAYMGYRVYSEASSIRVSASQLLSPYFLLAVLLGVLGYLTYTAMWYLYLRDIAGAPFRRVLVANLSGTYLSFSFNAAVGTLVKVRFIGADYFQVLAASVIEVSTEFLAGAVLIYALTRDVWALLLIVLLLLAFTADNIIYRLLLPLFKFLRAGRFFQSFYDGWRKAKSKPARLLVALVLGFLLVVINAGVLIAVSMTFGAGVAFSSAVWAVLYSTVLGSVLGTPGGLGGNELGVLMAIGNTGLNVIVAFAFKFLNQYMFALAGAFAFYRLALGEPGHEGPD